MATSYFCLVTFQASRSPLILLFLVAEYVVKRMGYSEVWKRPGLGRLTFSGEYRIVLVLILESLGLDLELGS